MALRILGLVVGVLLAANATAQEANARALAIAKQSRDVQASMQFIRAAVQAMPAKDAEDARLKTETAALVENPAPTFMKRLATPEAREKVRQELIKAGLLDASVTADKLFPPLVSPEKAAQSFESAPGSEIGGHHGYPGGLAQHTAFNLRAALDLARNYTATYSVTNLHRAVLVAAPTWHDAMKTWCLQWKADGTVTWQANIADTAAHHPFAVAEAFHRKLSPAFIVALASAHDAPSGKTAARVVNYLRAGAILAGVDPVAVGVLKSGKDGLELAHPPSFEATVNHLADHDYVLTGPAEEYVDASLERLIKSSAGAQAPTEAQVRWTRYGIESQISAMRLYSVWREGGDERVRELLKSLRLPLTVAAEK